jgi:hypothetical protein
MAGRILLTSVLSAVLLFVWGFLFWGVLNVGGQLMQPLPEELDLLASLRKSGATSGMYVYPMPSALNDPAGNQDFEAKHRAGPLLQLAYQAEGGPPMPPRQWALGLGHSFAVALLISSLLAWVAPSLPSYLSRVAFVLLLSSLTALWSSGGDLIWWFHSLPYCLGNTVYLLGGGLVMGLVTAALIRRDPVAR